MRSGWGEGSLHLSFDCGHISMGDCDDRSYGSHGHSDLLNFGLHAYGETFVTDIGSYTYTGPKQYHDYFRSTRGHNTITVDGEDQSILTTTWAIRNRARPLHRKWFTSPHFDYVTGSHDGYRRLSNPVVHRRKILFVKHLYWIIIDDIEGEGEHFIESYFHFAPNLKVNLNYNMVCSVEGTGASLSLFPVSSTEMEGKVVEGATDPIDGWYAYDYGRKEAAPVLKYRTKSTCPTTIYTILYPRKNGNKNLINVEKVAEDNRARAVAGIKISFSKSEDFLFTTPIAISSPVKITSDAQLLFIRKIEDQVKHIFTEDCSKLLVDDTVFIQSKEKVEFLSI